jgi:hypothetical protein
MMTLQHTILKALGNVQGYAMPEAALLADVNAIHHSNNPVTLTTLQAKCAQMVRAKLIVRVDPTDPDAEPKYRITDNGRAELAANS